MYKARGLGTETQSHSWKSSAPPKSISLTHTLHPLWSLGAVLHHSFTSLPLLRAAEIPCCHKTFDDHISV